MSAPTTWRGSSTRGQGRLLWGFRYRLHLGQLFHHGRPQLGGVDWRQLIGATGYFSLSFTERWENRSTPSVKNIKAQGRSHMNAPLAVMLKRAAPIAAALMP